MAAPIERIVDAHIHLWDPGQRRVVSVPRRSARARHGRHLGDVPAVRPAHVLRRVVELERREVRARRRGDRAALRRRDRAPGGARRRPPATPTRSSAASCPSDPIADIERLLDEQMRVTALPRHPPDGRRDGRARAPRCCARSPTATWSSSSWSHPDLLESAAETLADFDDLTIVVEHAGWPRSDEPEERELWKRGITALAALGDNVHCKLSGLAMPLHSNEASVLRPWIEYCLELVRRRPVHVRQQLPRRRHARHLRRALRRVRRRDRATSTPRRATSCSRRTPSASTAAEAASRGRVPSAR